LITQAIYNMMGKGTDEAEIKDFSPHDLRWSFVTEPLDMGVDINTVSKMAGHSSVNTTSRYDRRPETHLPHSCCA
jgi:integrase/recombinase XerD